MVYLCPFLNSMQDAISASEDYLEKQGIIGNRNSDDDFDGDWIDSHDFWAASPKLHRPRPPSTEKTLRLLLMTLANLTSTSSVVQKG